MPAAITVFGLAIWHIVMSSQLKSTCKGIQHLSRGKAKCLAGWGTPEVMTNLTHLYATFSNFEGKIPETWLRFSVLDLSWSQLTGAPEKWSHSCLWQDTIARCTWLVAIYAYMHVELLHVLMIQKLFYSCCDTASCETGRHAH